jgi:hypothetical protein
MRAAPSRLGRRARLAAVWLACIACVASSVRAEEQPVAPGANPERVVIKADAAQRWNDGAHEIWLLRGHCQVQQGLTHARANEGVIWIELGRYGERQGRVVAYLEGEVSLGGARDDGVSTLGDAGWLGTFESTGPVSFELPPPTGEPAIKPEIYLRGMARRDPGLYGAIRRTQFTQFENVAPPIDALPPGMRRLRAFPRSDAPVQAKWFPNEAGNEWIAVIDSGINLIIDGVDEWGSLDISADRVVIWTAGDQEPDLSGQSLQGREMPLEIYMEGNLVFRQGDRVIYADRMYYDVRQHVGTVLNAELLTPAPGYLGLLRMKARVIQQLSEDRFLAQDAFMTSSRMGKPTYRLQAGSIYLEDRDIPVVERFTGAPVLDEITGEQLIDHEKYARSQNNFVYLGDVPVLYWPILAGNLEDPTYYVKRLQFGNDQVFGAQIRSAFDGFQVFGLDQPDGTDWDLNLDYLSKRGVGVGTTFLYHDLNWAGITAPSAGFIDLWGINDHGLDNLGRGQKNLFPEADPRYRVYGQHRSQLPYDLQFTAELGLISDRNFLEQYYENEWDNFKDENTGVELKQTRDNWSWSITADARVNPFFTVTEWLPRGDHFWLGQSLLGDRLTWYEHTSLAYGQMKIASFPENPQQQNIFVYLPYENQVHGERFVTRQEIDAPFQLGPVKIVPYGLGEFGHWGGDINGDSIDRLYGQAGVRASIPFWAVNPCIESQLWNVHGLAHKIVLDGEFLAADANQDVREFALYDPIDDIATNTFRRQFAVQEFGVPASANPDPAAHGAVPFQFDARSYAIRSGLGSWVTSPSAEVADDLMAVRLGARQRWQTKRGPLTDRRIQDWITLDSQLTLFPKPDRDNFGEVPGLAQYDFRWHVGDRTTLVSDGFQDFFPNGLRMFSVGAYLNRTFRSKLYLGYTYYDTVFNSNILIASYSYRMSPKWVGTLGASLDLTGESIGQSAVLTRVGESFLVSLRLYNDVSKDNFGFSFNIEPRFLRLDTLGTRAGSLVPPAGVLGLE